MNTLLTLLQKATLPGEKAHREMMPLGRRNAILQHDKPPIPSAVLLLVFPEKKDLRIVFIRRSAYDGVHSGQIAFPGGKCEPQDRNVVETAIRETREETGLVEQISILGRLSSLYVPPSNFIIHPVVGYIEHSPAFRPDEREVSMVFSESMSILLSPQAKDTFVLGTSGHSIKAPCFVSNGLPIWGATAMILNEFLVLVRDNNILNN